MGSLTPWRRNSTGWKTEVPTSCLKRGEQIALKAMLSNGDGIEGIVQFDSKIGGTGQRLRYSRCYTP